MKILKRILPVYIIIVCALAMFSGCTQMNSYEGQNTVESMKKLYTGMEAANVRVNRYGGELHNFMYAVQGIKYRFAGDVMQYTYYGYDEETGDNYYEFNNGTELDTHHAGDEGWEFASKGSEGFYSYSRASRHYFADGEQLLNDHAAAVSGSYVSRENGEEGYSVVILHLDYDNEKLSQYESMAGITDMWQEYRWVMSDTKETEEDAMKRLCDGLHIGYTKDGTLYEYGISFYETDPNEPIERWDEEYWYQDPEERELHQ